jgi:hypothetical protein
MKSTKFVPPRSFIMLVPLFELFPIAPPRAALSQRN